MIDTRRNPGIIDDEDEQEEATAESTKRKSNPNNDADERGDDLSRDVFLFDRLDNDTALPVIKKLLKLNRRDQVTPINLYVNSSGGNGYNADAIIATIYSIGAPVNTICLGHALSGACEVLAAGTGTRSAYEFSTMMIHQTLWETDGDITNLEIQAAQGLRFREAQIQLLHHCTGQSRERIRKDIDRDFYMTAREAVSYGLIDRVIEHKFSRADDELGQSSIAAGIERMISDPRFAVPLSNIAISQASESKSVRSAALVREATGRRRSRNRRNFKK